MYTRLADASDSTRYVYSLYWAIAIIETIGYGDIRPVQPITCALLLLVMLTGVFVFSYLMGNVTTIVHLFYGLEEGTSNKREDVRLAKTMLRLVLFLYDRNLLFILINWNKFELFNCITCTLCEALPCRLTLYDCRFNVLISIKRYRIIFRSVWTSGSCKSECLC